MIRDTIFRKTEAVLRRPEGGFRFFAALREKFAKPLYKTCPAWYTNRVRRWRFPVPACGVCLFEGAPFPCAEAAENILKEVLLL